MSAEVAFKILAARGPALPGLGQEALIRFRERWGTQMPADVAQMYALFDGDHPGFMNMGPGVECVRFWPWEEWEAVAVECAASGRLGWIFADYCINAWLYVIVPGQDGEASTVLSWSEDVPTLRWSFVEFVVGLVTDADRMLHGEVEPSEQPSDR